MEINRFSKFWKNCDFFFLILWIQKITTNFVWIQKSEREKKRRKRLKLIHFNNTIKQQQFRYGQSIQKFIRKLMTKYSTEWFLTMALCLKAWHSDTDYSLLYLVQASTQIWTEMILIKIQFNNGNDSFQTIATWLIYNYIQHFFYSDHFILIDREKKREWNFVAIYWSGSPMRNNENFVYNKDIFVWRSTKHRKLNENSKGMPI